MKKITRFLWLCSGASTQLLEKCPTESSKYAGMGATILFTGLFAALAGGYAIYTVFDNWIAAAVFGLVWGLMIFNLDRYIVSSMRKNGTQTQVLKTALPRILLALLIALVISKPLELKVFQKEIDAELTIMEQQLYKKQDSLVNSRHKAVIDKLENQIVVLKGEINAKTMHRNALRKAAREEADGTGGSGKKNLGPIYKVKKADADIAEAELKSLMEHHQNLIVQYQSEIEAQKVLLKTEIDQLDRQKYNGLAARLQALNHLTKKSTAINIANWFIILLFIAIELSPILVKLISPKGPYDHLLTQEEHVFETEKLEVMAKNSQTARKKAERMPQREQSFVEEGLSASLR